MSLYKGSQLISGAIPNSANQSLSNLNSAGQDKFDAKANTNLNNLTSTSSTNFDGQWVKSNLTIASQATTPKTTAIEYNLSSYLPNDNYNYEVFFSGNSYSAPTSGSEAALILGSSALNNYVYVCRGRTTSNMNIVTAGSAIIPISASDRKIIVTPFANNSGTFTLAALGYRRIGTNA